MANGGPTTLLQENELRQFLKVVRPDWSQPRRNGRSDIQRVMAKLRSIGVTDKFDFMQRVTKNRINEDLAAHGHPCFSRETLECVRKHTTFFRAIETLNESHYRQTGLFAHVPQMLSQTNLRTKAKKSAQESREDADFSGNEEHSPFTSEANHVQRRVSPQPAQSAPQHASAPRSGGTVGIGGAVVSFDIDALQSTVDDSSCVSPAPTLPPRLRGYRGEVGRRSAKGSWSDLGSPDASHAHMPRCPSAPSSADVRGGARASRSRGSASCESSLGAGLQLLAAAADARAGGDRNLGRTLLRFAGAESEKSFTPKSQHLHSVRDLESEIGELHLVASRSLNSSTSLGAGFGPVEEAYEKLAKVGEEDLACLDHAQTFVDQGGTDAQALHIAAYFGKLGLDVRYVARLLRKSKLTVGEVCDMLDGVAVDSIHGAANLMIKKPRPSAWAGFVGMPVATPPTHKERAASSPASIGKGNGDRSSAQPRRTGKGVLWHAESMLKEQKDLDEKAKLLRKMDIGTASRLSEHVPQPNGDREHVCSNIRKRMKAEREKEAEQMFLQQSCINIRRNLLGMGNAKRDISNLRRSIEAEKPQAAPALFATPEGFSVMQGLLKGSLISRDSLI